MFFGEAQVESSSLVHEHAMFRALPNQWDDLGRVPGWLKLRAPLSPAPKGCFPSVPFAPRRGCCARDNAAKASRDGWPPKGGASPSLRGRRRDPLAVPTREHQCNSGGVEHSGLGVDGFTKVLGADEGVVAAAFEDDPVNMVTVPGNHFADVFGGKEEQALDAVALLSLEGITALALEEGAGSPGGTPEDTGGVGGGGHGVEVLVELGGRDQLGFVNGKEEIGGSANHLGGMSVEDQGFPHGKSKQDETEAYQEVWIPEYRGDDANCRIRLGC